MFSPRIISVFGATGLQGGALVDALLKDGTFVPRAISRDPESEASKKLRERVALRSSKAIRWIRWSSLTLYVAVKPFSRSRSPVFFLPNPEGKGELVQGKNIVDAAKEAGVKFFIWSVSKISGGKYQNALPYDEKEAVREYLESSGMMHATLHLPGFLENLYSGSPLTKKRHNGYEISVPIIKPTDILSFAWITRDVPTAALALLKNYTDSTKDIIGKTYPVVSVNTTYGTLAQLAGKALGTEVTFVTLPPTGLPTLDEMWYSNAEYNGLYTATSVPNPDLVALGMRFSTVEEFMEDLKTREGQ
ncbi:NmrA domain-containing protein [Mycena sanguinolenta]|uniref:NmrA domain-containing protein n=1 Tax=Mycena sanguinolenta TaxID=230812 RepID=A0A8H6XS52_9AGAR|nr:NmrA domain-containing protein [Mycena sanguinolenta]